MKKCECGPYFLEKFNQLMGMKDCYFNDCCEQHDRDYKNKPGTRKEADKDFLNCMLNKDKHKNMAYSFYYFVRAFGWIYWR